MNNQIIIGDNGVALNHNCLDSYVNAVKMIYIDPPYNTKSNKSYIDKKSSEDWLLYITKRIQDSYKYLKEDGVIFISIDDNEYAALKVECDKIFRKENFIGTFITQQATRSNSKLINTVHEYILCYAKDRKKTNSFKIKRVNIPEQKKMIELLRSRVKDDFNVNGKTSATKLLNKEIKSISLKYGITWIKNYSNVDDSGEIFFSKDLSTPGTPREVNIPSIGMHLDPLKTRGWSSDEKFIKLHNSGLLVYKLGRPYEKHYLIDAEDNASSLLSFYSRQGTNDLNKLGLRGIFDTPKPVGLVKQLIRFVVKGDDDIIMDFFAGSGTTAQAVYEVNSEDGYNCKYILIQKEEEIVASNKVYDICLGFNIKPNVSDILLLRVKTYLELNKINDSYILTKI